MTFIDGGLFGEFYQRVQLAVKWSCPFSKLNSLLFAKAVQLTDGCMGRQTIVACIDLTYHEIDYFLFFLFREVRPLEKLR